MEFDSWTRAGMAIAFVLWVMMTSAGGEYSMTTIRKWLNVSLVDRIIIDPMWSLAIFVVLVLLHNVGVYIGLVPIPLIIAVRFYAEYRVKIVRRGPMKPEYVWFD